MERHVGRFLLLTFIGYLVTVAGLVRTSNAATKLDPDTEGSNATAENSSEPAADKATTKSPSKPVLKKATAKITIKPVPDNITRGHQAIFIAGLEGTLHHFWVQISVACVHEKKCHFPSPALKLSLWEDRHNLDALIKSWNSWETDGDSILYLNGPGNLLPYPDTGSSGNPQVQNYAKAAIANNDNLKVVVMLRNAGDLLQSAKKRSNCTEQELVGAAHVLLEQIKTLPEKSWICLDVDTIPALAQKIDVFLTDPHTGKHHFDMERVMKEYYQETHISRCLSDECSPPELEAATEAIRHECSKPYMPGAGFAQNTEARANQVFEFLFG